MCRRVISDSAAAPADGGSARLSAAAASKTAGWRGAAVTAAVSISRLIGGDAPGASARGAGRPGCPAVMANAEVGREQASEVAAELWLLPGAGCGGRHGTDPASVGMSSNAMELPSSFLREPAPLSG